jgi:hypothetical protein
MLQQHRVRIGIGKEPISIGIISENKVRLCVTNLELKLLGPISLYSLYNPLGDRVLNSEPSTIISHLDTGNVYLLTWLRVNGFIILNLTDRLTLYVSSYYRKG